jgi:hypothetical protein
MVLGWSTLATLAEFDFALDEQQHNTEEEA